MLLAAIAVTEWVLSSWSLMIVIGIVHAQILPAVIPISLGVALSLTVFPILILTFIAIISGLAE